MKLSFLSLFILSILSSGFWSQALADDELLSREFLDNLENRQEKRFKKFAYLQILNKITANFVKIKVEIGQTITFGNLRILPELCWKSRSTDFPEDKLLLKLFEKTMENQTKEIFHGWMFSSSPSISSLEHPVYDITILKCHN